MTMTTVFLSSSDKCVDENMIDHNFRRRYAWSWSPKARLVCLNGRNAICSSSRSVFSYECSAAYTRKRWLCVVDELGDVRLDRTMSFWIPIVASALLTKWGWDRTKAKAALPGNISLSLAVNDAGPSAVGIDLSKYLYSLQWARVWWLGGRKYSIRWRR